MQFSLFSRIKHRSEFFDKFFKKYSKLLDVSQLDITREKYEQLLEIIVQLILQEDYDSLIIILNKQNGKIAKMFFNYLTCSNFKKINKEDIINRIIELNK